jgi:hypothetical protein
VVCTIVPRSSCCHQYIWAHHCPRPEPRPGAWTTDVKTLHLPSAVRQCACTQVKSRCDALKAPACVPSQTAQGQTARQTAAHADTNDHTVLLPGSAAKLAAAQRPGPIDSCRPQRWQPSARRPRHNHVNTQPDQHTPRPLVAPASRTPACVRKLQPFQAVCSRCASCGTALHVCMQQPHSPQVPDSQKQHAQSMHNSQVICAST